MGERWVVRSLVKSWVRCWVKHLAYGLERLGELICLMQDLVSGLVLIHLQLPIPDIVLVLHQKEYPRTISHYQ